MPKITAHGGATNAREADVSPAADAGEPQVVAEDDLGLTTSVEAAPEAPAEDEPVAEDATPAYEGMTLAELREAAGARDLPTYGTKAQLVERLREDDAEDAAE